MSLDVYVKYKKARKERYYENHSACGSNMPIDDYEAEVTEWHANITHNMNKMAMCIPVKFEVNGKKYDGTLYSYVWRPEEQYPSVANTDIVGKALEVGICYMVTHRDELLQYNPSNGWGSYDAFLMWLVNYMRVCKENPDCLIEVDR